jgi:septal ring factor EnvC (AmiA/AmiB activator)
VLGAQVTTPPSADPRPPSPVGQPGDPRRGRRAPWALGITAVCVVAATLGFLVADQVAHRHQYDRTASSLESTRRHIARTASQLASLQRDLLALGNQIGSDTTALEQDQSQLKGAQSALGSVQSNVTQQASLITSLQTCLGGVEQALNALAVGNRAGAVTQLEAVSTSCSAAAAASG